MTSCQKGDMVEQVMQHKVDLPKRYRRIAKRPYAVPELQEYGDLSELTLGSTTGIADTGAGSFGGF